MGILGRAWGTADELLHPRDRFGRFAKKRAMPEATGKKILGFLDRFNPRTFQSDGQAAQYLMNKAKPGRFPGDDQKRLHFDWDEANDHIRAGDIDAETQKFIQMMDNATVALPEQLIVTKTVGPEAFGLTPETIDLEDGGIRDLQGRLFADRGFSAAVVGTPQGKAPGRIAITIAIPRGTKAAIPARAGTDRAMFMARGQRIRISKVKPDGTGGWTIMAIAEPEGLSDQTPEPMMPGRRGAGLSEAQRRERITPAMSPEQRQTVAQQNEREMQTGPSAPTPVNPQAQPAQPAPASPAPAPPAPVQGPTSPATGVPERREPVLKDAIGPSVSEGKSTAEIADTPPPAEAPPAPASPESFRQALATADLKAPSRGKRQKEFDDARVGIVSGRQNPQDALRQLDTDIEVNKRALERQKSGTEKPDPELAQDIQDQEALADLISTHHGVPRRGQEAKGTSDGTSPTLTPAAPKPSTSAKKAGPKATPGAPSTKKEATPKAPTPAPDRRTKAELLTEAGDAGKPRMTKAQLIQAIEAKKAGAAAPAAPAPEKKLPGSGLTPDNERRVIAKAKAIKARKSEADFDDEDRRIVDLADKALARQSGGAKKAPAKKAAPTKVARPTVEESRELSDLSDTERRGYQKFRRAGQSHNDAMQSARDEQGAKVTSPAKAVAKKAVPAKAAPSPEDAAEEAFKARVTEAGLPDRVTALRAMAREQKIRGFSTMNKRQLQSALLGDEVPKAGKIGVVSPAKMVPHLEAAESDQAARTLLEKHTLVDLKALAKERGIELPKKGATKPRVTDMVLEDIRGPQTGIEGRTPDTGLPEDLGQMGYITLPGANGDKISQEIAQAVPDDPESLRRHRDNLEALSKQFRGDGDKQGANMAQAAADAMGMRAQTISGVEEATPPVKRVAKKAVPAVPEGEEAPEVERPLEKMLKPELLAVAQREGASSVRPSWSKARILDEIKKNRRMDSSRGEDSAEDRLRRELGQLPGGPERDLGPNQGPLQLPDRAPTAEEIARDAVPGAPVPAKKATKKAARKAVPDSREIMLQTLESGERDVGRAADAVSGQLKETFGDQLRRTDAEKLRQAVKESGLGDIEGNTAEEIFDNTIKKALEDRMRELGMLPEDPAKPTRAQKRVPKGSVPGRAVTTPDRKQSFREGWDGQGFIATGTAASSMDEVRDDIESGKITPEEGVRRLDSDILFNEDESNDLLAELEGMDPDDRENSDLNLRRAQLEESIRSQKKAKTFIREHFKDEAPITRQELEGQLDGPEKAALDRVDVGDLKEAARQDGLGDIEGDDKDTVVQNIAKAVAARELKTRAAAKAAPTGISTPEQPPVKAAPGTAAGRITTARLTPGTRIMVRPGTAEGTVMPTTRKTGSIPVTVTSVEGVTGTGARSRGRYRVTVTDDNGNILKLGANDNAASQTQMLEPPPKAAKVTKAAAPSAPEAPVAPAKKAAKFLPPLKDGTQRKSFTNVEVGDVVQRAGARQGPAKRVTKIERGPGGIDLTFEDGTTVNGNPNTAAWMGRDAPEAPTAPTPTPEVPTPTEAAPRPGKVVRAAGAPPGWKARKIGDDTYEIEDSGGKVLGTLRQEDYENIVPGDNGIGRIIRRKQFQFQPADGGRERPVETAKLGDAMSNLAFQRSRATPAPSAPTPAPKATVPAKAAPAPPKVVDLKNPTRHDAEVIGTGLDIDRKGEDRQWMDVVQSDLDRGLDGRQIADGLRREADSQRTLHNITESVVGTEGASPSARVNRMELMADRLEGVRPIKKAEPPKKAAADRVGNYGTLQASQAASTARAQLRAGKTRAEVAAGLRAAANGVASRDHDPHPVSRVGDPTPSEKTAMKRRDARLLRELAAEIVAEGVAERAAAKAVTKGGTRAKVPTKSQAELERDGNIMSGGNLERMTREGQARERAAKQAEIDEIEARKNLTGPIGEVIANQLNDTVKRVTEAKSDQEANDAISGLLTPELKQLAQRVGVSTGGSKELIRRRITERLRGTEAPTTSAERAVPKAEAPGGLTTQAPKPHSWGTFGQRGDQHYYHPDGEIPRTMARLGADAQIDVGGGESLHNAMGDIASDMVMGRISGDAGVARLRRLAAKLPAGSGARSRVAGLADDLDRPAVAMPRLPDQTPGPVRRLLQQVITFPIARATGQYGGASFDKSLVDKIADFVREKASGESSIVGMGDDLARLILNHTHESQEGSMGLRALTQPLFKDDSEISQALLAWAKEIRARRRAT